MCGLAGPLSVGSLFTWKSGPGTIRSRLQVLDPPHAMAWTGRTLGISAVHVWRFESDGKETVVRTEESWNGLLARLFPNRLRPLLQRAIDSGLRYLKDEVESRNKENR